MRECGQRHRGAVCSAYINVIERFRTPGKVRRNLHYDVILIELAVHDRDLPLSERVVESIIDIGGSNSEARRSVAIDNDLGF